MHGRMIFLPLVCLILFSQATNAQQCNTSQRPFSTPTENYFFNGDGTITDLDSGLTWQRCVAGQKWTGSDCAGKAQTFSWQEAFKYEDEFNRQTASGQKWRVPRLAELAGIVERQCVNPRINLQIFPETPSEIYWTANARKGHPGEAFALSFAADGVKSESQTQRFYLRLVAGRD